MVEDRETRLPLLLSPVRRISQWSDIDELVEPVRHGDERENMNHKRKLHCSHLITLLKHCWAHRGHFNTKIQTVG